MSSSASSASSSAPLSFFSIENSTLKFGSAKIDLRQITRCYKGTDNQTVILLGKKMVDGKEWGTEFILQCETSDKVDALAKALLPHISPRVRIGFKVEERFMITQQKVTKQAYYLDPPVANSNIPLQGELQASPKQWFSSFRTTPNRSSSPP